MGSSIVWIGWDWIGFGRKVLVLVGLDSVGPIDVVDLFFFKCNDIFYCSLSVQLNHVIGGDHAPQWFIGDNYCLIQFRMVSFRYFQNNRK